jgi:hypothetical protein
MAKIALRAFGGRAVHGALFPVLPQQLGEILS